VGLQKRFLLKSYKIPVILICQGCATAYRKGQPPLYVLMCGLKDHIKPDPKAVGAALEKWVPKFQVARRSGPIAVTFVSTHASATGKCNVKQKGTLVIARLGPDSRTRGGEEQVLYLAGAPTGANQAAQVTQLSRPEQENVIRLQNYETISVFRVDPNCFGSAFFHPDPSS